MTRLESWEPFYKAYNCTTGNPLNLCQTFALTADKLSSSTVTPNNSNAVLQNCKTESPFQNVESRTCYTREVLPCTDYDTSRNHLRFVFSDSCLELIRETAALIIRVEIMCMYVAN